MKRLSFLVLLLFISSITFAQYKIDDVTRIPRISFGPEVYIKGLRQNGFISLKSIHENGLEIVLNDKSFKAVQFIIVYDCHSRAYFDFSPIQYYGDKVLPTDKFLQRLIWVDDIIDIANVVIQRGQERYLMKEVSFRIVN